MGEQLKEARMRLGYSEKEASEETRVPVSILTAFEADDFSHTGAYVYASGFLKQYCAFLGFDASPFLEEFRERSAAREKKSAMPRARVISLFSFHFRSPAFIAAGCVMLLFVGYFGINLIASYLSPAISFSDGGGSQETQERVFVFQGKTHSEANLTMNGRIMYLNESGEFKEQVLLAGGLNAFEFVVENKFGKITKIIRYIYVK